MADRLAYGEYIVSPEWFARRRRWDAEYRERTGQPPVCIVCGKLWFLANGDLHHLTYERRGNEAFDDLMALCRKHHSALHATLESDPRWLRTMGRSMASWTIASRLQAEVHAELEAATGEGTGA
jgi:hypothetical protein